MSYLSRIRLKPEIRQSSQLALLITGNSYGMHRLLWDLFPGRDGQQRNFLFREEQESNHTTGYIGPVYYVLSEHLPEQISPLFDVESKAFTPQLEAGDQLAFRLRANPVVSRKREGKKHSAAHDVVMDAQQQILNRLCIATGLEPQTSKAQKLAALKELPAKLLEEALVSAQVPNHIRSIDEAMDWSVRQAQVEWLSGERASRSGYMIESPETLQTTGYTWKPLPEKGRSAGFSSLDYEGVLIVTNPEIFLRTVCAGLGKARAFGCGLMLIKRI